MEKNTSGPATAPPPTAPPSYEEAVAQASGANPTAPYPMGHSPMPMPMPTPMPAPYPQQGKAGPMPMPMPMPMQMPVPMPVPGNYGRPADYPTQAYSGEPTFVGPPSAPEVRVIHQHVTYTLGPNPVKMTCPTCHADIKTTTTTDHQPSAHICCIVLCLLGCCLCSCLPYFMRAFLSVHHFCPNCKNYIGTWKG